MKRMSLLPLVLSVAAALAACEQAPESVTGPESEKPGPVGIAQSTIPPPAAPWLSDYFPLNPHQFGIRTYYWYDEEEYFLAMITGTETVPYVSGPIEATKLLLEDEEIGLHVDGKKLWMGVIQGDYYVSLTCAMDAFPFDVAGKVWDGMFVDLTGLSAVLVKRDGSSCIPLPENDRITLFKIDDLNIFGERYANALVLWSLEPGGFVPMDFDGLEYEWGLTLPTSDEAHDNYVDGFVIFGFQKGVVAMGETGDDGLDDLALLVSEVPTNSVPVHWATGGGTIDWGAAGRVTYGFNAAVDLAGNAGGALQFNWRDATRKWHGAIDCLSVGGNQAYASGTITSGDYEGMYFTFGVEDNGEGVTATGPDRISTIVRSATPWDCDDLFPSPFKEWTNGNVQIKSFR